MDRQAQVAADLSRAKEELEAVLTEAEGGHRMGELLRRKVDLQQHIQKLRYEAMELRTMRTVNQLAQTHKIERAAVERRVHKYRRFIDAKIPRRKAPLRVTVVPETPTTRGTTLHPPFPASPRAPTEVGATPPPTPQQMFIAESVGLELSQRGHSPSAMEVDEEMDPDSTTTTTTTATNAEVMGTNFLQIIQSSKLGLTEGDSQTEISRRAREADLQSIERRRAKVACRFDLVEDMFEQAVERRLRAMARLASDPPAERLIGHSALQHIPIALLPGELQQTAMALQSTRFAEMTATEDSPLGRAKQPDTSHGKSFFLTHVDTKEGTHVGRAKNEEGREEEAHQEDNNEEEGSGLKERPTEEEEKEENGEEKAEAPVDEDLLRRWRELGYTAVYLPASRRLIDPRSDGRRPYDPNAWMQLEPLPPLHLVQRRLPEEVTKVRDPTSVRRGVWRPVRERQLPTIRRNNEKKSV